MKNMIEVPQEAEVKTTVRLKKNVADALSELVADRKRILADIEANEILMIDKLSFKISSDSSDSKDVLEACELLRLINRDRLQRERQWSVKKIDPVFEIFDVFTSDVFERE